VPSTRTEAGSQEGPKSRGLAHAIAWTGAMRWTAQLASWASSIFVVRLLSPADYGIAGIAISVAAWATTLASFGVLESITYGSRPDREEYAELFGFTIATGIAALLVVSASAFPIASRVGDVRLTSAIAASGLVVLFSVLAIVPTASLTRSLEFRRSASIDFAKSITQTLLVLGLASAGFGFWSLIAGQIFGAVTAFAFALTLAPLRPRMPTNIQRRLSAAKWFFGGSLSWQSLNGADSLIAGAVAGTTGAGHFNVAKTLAFMPIDKLVSVVTAVSPSVFADAQSQPELLEQYARRILELVATVVMIPAAGLFLVADVAVPFVVGPQWEHAVAPLRVLAVYATLHALLSVVGQVSAVTGGPRVNALSAMLALPVGIGLFRLLGDLWGATGIALVWVVIFPILSIAPLVALHRHGGLRIGMLLGCLRSPLIATACMAVVVQAIRTSIRSIETTALGLGIVCSSGAIVAVLALVFQDSEAGRMIRSVASALRGRPARSSSR
jgi:teichuronic acid exporter